MKTIGIIGGMGPAATADLFAKIIANTAAAASVEHVPVLIDSNSAIPDRTAAILHGGVSPVPELLKSALRLEKAGAELLTMACNTAHYFCDDILPALSIPFLHMPQETAREAKRRGYRRVALLATDGTCAAGIYQQAFSACAENISLVLLQPEEQRLIMELIYENVKAGRWDLPKERLSSLLSSLAERGAEAFVLGCTELPLAFEHYGLAVPVIDPTEVLARAAILAAGAALLPESEMRKSSAKLGG